MDGDIPIGHRVAALNARHILRRAAGEIAGRLEWWKNGSSGSEAARWSRCGPLSEDEVAGS